MLFAKISAIAYLSKKSFSKRPYLILTLSFISWVLLFDSVDIKTQYQLSQRINKLLTEQVYYKEQIEIMTKEQQALISNEALLEKFAREKYFMKKPTEDIYIIIE